VCRTAGLSDAVQVVADARTCALRCNGTVVCWPQNEMPDSGVSGALMPTTVSGLSNVIQIAVGSSSCALLTDRTVECWGNNDRGQLGNGTTVDSWEPVTVPGLSTVVQGSSELGRCLLASGRWNGEMLGIHDAPVSFCWSLRHRDYQYLTKPC
jgi:hypothetical protein